MRVKNLRFKKLLALSMALIMILSLGNQTMQAKGKEFQDIQGHWAKELIETLADKDLVAF